MSLEAAHDLLNRSLGQLARKIPGATVIFHHQGLDFCCGGNKSLRRAAEEKNLDSEVIANALLSIASKGDIAVTEDMPLPGLIDFILENFHQVHRAELPELVRLATKVERVHIDKPDCPHGLSDHLLHMAQELEMHMQKEEQILFPMIKRGTGSMVLGPISVMRHEHDDDSMALRELERLTNNMQPPLGACNSWCALYLGLQKLRNDLMEHIHLENNLLFIKQEEQFGKP
ncbi:MAG: iron-sulfur cluster repair protein YtfE [Cellvibrio sp.]|uniref:iron-sulfur cluster repair protein YtfE n=1 Tax=Cellvibrio sp. TaxID=1965322 RepID=UPI00271C76EE|nr:iron-sulfur cluster repair protein YtfE [Cellvibrio sp.]